MIGRRIRQEVAVAYLIDEGGVDYFELRLGRGQEDAAAGLAGKAPQHFLPLQ